VAGIGNGTAPGGAKERRGPGCLGSIPEPALAHLRFRCTADSKVQNHMDCKPGGEGSRDARQPLECLTESWLLHALPTLPVGTPFPCAFYL
jgi:hypothetical protein